MRKIPIVFISLFFVCSSLMAENLADQLNFNSLPIPASLRATMQNYLSMIGVNTVSANSVWAGNSGIQAYNSQILANNSCFNDLARAFENSLPNSFGADVRMDQRISEAPGWLWQKAMQFSNNNPNLAMMLIGQCSHDDISPCEINPGVGRNNPRFIPGSLGTDTIINPSLAQQIADVQAPTMGASALPAKYYHTLGAAYLTCALVRDGMPAPMASMVQLTLARTYRVQRICQGSATYGNYTSSIQNALARYPEKTIRELVGMVQSREMRPSLNLEDSVNRYFISHTNDLMSQYGNSVEQVIAHMEMEMSFVDATELFKSQVVGESGGCRLPQMTDELTRRSLDVSNNFNCQNNTVGGTSGLPRDRCEAAKSRLKTWWADMRWTEEQHRLGAEFAKSHCRSEPHFMNNLNDLSCSALQQVQPNTPATGTESIETSVEQ